MTASRHWLAASVALCALATVACGGTPSANTDVSMSLDVLPSVIDSPHPAATFGSMIELPSGVIVANGVESGGSIGNDWSALWRSDDNGATFERTPGLDTSSTAPRTLIELTHHDGTTYALGVIEDGFYNNVIWSSTDDGMTWTEERAPGAAGSWVGVVGGHPTYIASVTKIDAVGTHPGIVQLRDGQWTYSTVPDFVHEATIVDIVQLADGTALAFGLQCGTDPDCDGSWTNESAPDRLTPDWPRDQLLWASSDGGATWVDESSRLSNGPGVQTFQAGAATSQSVITGAVRATADGTATEVVIATSSDGVAWSTLPAISTGEGSEPLTLVALEAVGEHAVAIVRSKGADGKSVDRLVVQHLGSGDQELFELEGTLGLAATTGFASTNRGIVVLGMALENETLRPRLVRLS